MAETDSSGAGMTVDGKPVRSPRSDALGKYDQASEALAKARKRFWTDPGPPDPLFEPVLEAMGLTLDAVRAAIDLRDINAAEVARLVREDLRSEKGGL